QLNVNKLMRTRERVSVRLEGTPALMRLYFHFSLEPETFRHHSELSSKSQKNLQSYNIGRLYGGFSLLGRRIIFQLAKHLEGHLFAHLFAFFNDALLSWNVYFIV